MKIRIIVSEGLVQAVYADGPADVEVIDLDEPAYMTEAEKAEMDARTAAAEAIQTDPSFSAVW